MPRGVYERDKKSKKNILKPAAKPSQTPLIDEPDPEPEVVEAKPAAKKNVTRTQTERWVETVEPEAQTIEVMEPEADEEADLFDSIFDDFGGDTAEWSIKVFRLPEYQKNGSTALQNKSRAFCDDLPLTADYMAVIKENWGPGVYQLELRERNIIRKRRTIQIAAPAGFPYQRPPRAAGNGATVNPAPMAGIPYEPRDPGEELDALLDRMSKIRRVFGNGDFNGHPAPAPAPAGPPLTTESALLHLISQDGEVVDQFAKSLRGLLRRDGGGGGHEPTWMDILDSVIKADLIPKTIQSAKSLLLETIGAMNGQKTMGAEAVAPRVETPNQPGPPANLNGLHDQVQRPRDGQISQAPGDHQAPQGTAEEQIVTRTLQTLLDSCESYPLHAAACEDPECSQYGHIGGPASWIIEQEIAYPQLGNLINMFILTPVDQLTTWVSSQPEFARYATLPHWNEWITNLQKALKDATQEGDPKP